VTDHPAFFVSCSMDQNTTFLCLIRILAAAKSTKLLKDPSSASYFAQSLSTTPDKLSTVFEDASAHWSAVLAEITVPCTVCKSSSHVIYHDLNTGWVCHNTHPKVDKLTMSGSEFLATLLMEAISGSTQHITQLRECYELGLESLSINSEGLDSFSLVWSIITGHWITSDVVDALSKFKTACLPGVHEMWLRAYPDDITHVDHETLRS
jgi:hypothetical protein